MENPLLFLKIFLLFNVYAKLNHLSLYSAFCLLTDVLQVVDIEIYFLPYIKMLLYGCGDIEINPGCKQSSLNFCRWNLSEFKCHCRSWIYHNFIITGIYYRTEKNWLDKNKFWCAHPIPQASVLGLLLCRLCR